MVLYFPRYLLASTTTTCFAVVMTLLPNYMPMYLIVLCVNGATLCLQVSECIFTIATNYKFVYEDLKLASLCKGEYSNLYVTK